MKIVVVSILLVFILVGCKQTKVAVKSLNTQFISKNDVNKEDKVPLFLDYTFNSKDPEEIKNTAAYIFSGNIIGIKGVDVISEGLEGFLETTYRVKVNEIFKGDLGKEIDVTLLGGAMSRGEYIKKLDEKNIYDKVFAQKSNKLIEEAGYSKEDITDPRSLDPEELLIQNFGMNPTSESFISANDPESFVFFLEKSDDGKYFASMFEHSLKYLKDDKVYSVTKTGEETEPFEAQKLR